MNCGNSDVCGIDWRTAWDCPGGKQVFGQPRYVVIDVELRENAHNVEPLFSQRRIPHCGFVENELRDVYVERHPSHFPPLPRNFLVRSYD